MRTFGTPIKGRVRSVGHGLAIAALAALAGSWLVAPEAGAAPHLLTYQGYLTDDGGLPLNETVDLEFAIDDSASGGTALWTEAHAATPVEDGIFHVILGDQTPLDPALFDATALWLETRVDGVAMTPRRPFLSVPYAFRAEVADVALSGGGGDSDWTINGSDIYHLTGNVGIGTSAPTDRLHVTDPLFARLQLERTGGSIVKTDASLSSGSVGTTSAHPFRLVTNNTVRMALDTTGLIGIGTTSPVHTLHVNGSTARAIYALQSSASGSLIGVFGETNSITGTGVRGQANHATGQAVGVHGQATGTGGVGVFGEASSGPYGVKGTSASASGAGVAGFADATTGTTYGLYGRANSASGVGVYAFNANPSGGAAYFDGDATTAGTHTVTGGSNQLDITSTGVAADGELNLNAANGITATAQGAMSLNGGGRRHARLG